MLGYPKISIAVLRNAAQRRDPDAWQSCPPAASSKAIGLVQSKKCVMNERFGVHGLFSSHGFSEIFFRIILQHLMPRQMPVFL